MVRSEVLIICVVNLNHAALETIMTSLCVLNEDLEQAESSVNVFMEKTGVTIGL